MGKRHFFDNFKSWLDAMNRFVDSYVKLGMDKDVAEILFYSLNIKTYGEEEEESDNTLYDVTYQPFVYPPNSTPPTCKY